MEETTTKETERFVKAVLNGKNIKASKHLEKII